MSEGYTSVVFNRDRNDNIFGIGAVSVRRHSEVLEQGKRNEEFMGEQKKTLTVSMIKIYI